MRELRRKFYDTLLAWKKNHRQECLLIKGARQIGKTYIARKFGKENYESFIEINFIREPDFKSVFTGTLSADAIRTGISAIRRDVRFVDGKTLLFLDEIQDCPNARTAFKFLAEDGRMDVIASGSLLGIKYKAKKRREENEPRSIPVGFERTVTMHSLSFEEFLWAKGYSNSDFDLLRGHFERREMVPEAVNARFLQLVREYIVVGGLPEVVREYLENNHFGVVQSLQEKILSDYIDDIHNYAEPVDVPKIERCYQAIPRILAKENRKFKWGEVDKLGSARKYLTSVDWLKDAKLVEAAECVNDLEVGLSAYVQENWFKLYLSDIGLLSATYGMPVKKQLLDDILKGTVKGGLYENFHASVLRRTGLPLRYYRNGEDEIEFLLETEQGVIPLEVKAKTGRTLSLNKALERDDIPFGYKFTAGNVGVTGKKITLPHYMSMFV